MKNFNHINPILRTQIILLVACIWGFSGILEQSGAEDHNLPNILWLVSEDNSPFLGCYGDENAITPNLDKLASEGIVYNNAFANAPVCAPMRNSIITGIYASTLGCQNMRSTNRIPASIRFLPQYLREKGYYCTNNAKEDYNTLKPENVWDESSGKAHYKNRKEGQPFFAVFNTGISHEAKIHLTNLIPKKDLLHKPKDMNLAPYHPDLSEIRRCYANYYDYVTKMDGWIGEKLKELELHGLTDETIVFYYSDHGGVLPRSKRFLFESGTKIPFIIRIPEKYKHLSPGEAGDRSDRLISLLDLAPTMLSLTGIEIPEYMSGKPFLGEQSTNDPEYVYFFRQRMDERYDMMRAVRDSRFRYIRNYMPHRIYGQHLWYLWRSPATRAWETACKEGDCNEIRNRFWGFKDAEELYDVLADPHNINNLANDPEYRADLDRMRAELKRWVRDNRDTGFIPEAMMVKQAGKSTIYEMAQASDFPLERIIETAELVSSHDKQNLPKLIHRLSDSEAAVRYWAATAFAFLGQEHEQAVPELKKLMQDPDGNVRIAAAEALCRMGYKEKSLDLLVQEMRNESPWIQLHAINALDALEDDARLVVMDILSGAPRNVKTDEYLNRSFRYLIKKLKPGWDDYY